MPQPSKLFTIGGVSVWRLPDRSGFYYESPLRVDADGSPFAYNPQNTGLDDLQNAGSPGNWWALATDSKGHPYIQGPGDPAPGYYVSMTALMDPTKVARDPARYVDAEKIPFIVLPLRHQGGAALGDFAYVWNRANGKSSFAIFADLGPSKQIGEGSIALVQALGLNFDPRHHAGGADRGIVTLVFPGSGNRLPRSVDEINTLGRKSLEAWGGEATLQALIQ